MREIKFRGKIKNDSLPGVNYFVYGYYRIESGKSWIYDGNIIYEVVPETVGQFTGLKDKCIKEIYEGDIVRVEYLHYPETDKEKLIATYISPITFRDGFFAFADDYEYHVPCRGCYRTEVIGNIHDNPDLINSSK